MGTHDPMEGGRLAVQWLKQLKKDLVAQMGQKDYDQQHSVQKYWEDWRKAERECLATKLKPVDNWFVVKVSPG